MKNVKHLSSSNASGQPTAKSVRNNVRVFPTGEVRADYRPASLSEGIRVFFSDEFRRRPFRVVAQLALIVLVFLLLFVVAPAIFGS